MHAVLHLSSGQEQRYVDQKKMGQVFLTRQPLEQVPIPDYAGLGPEALEISRDAFKVRLKPFRGEIKGILTRGDFVAGIGNVYARRFCRRRGCTPIARRVRLRPRKRTVSTTGCAFACSKLSRRCAPR